MAGGMDYSGLEQLLEQMKSFDGGYEKELLAFMTEMGNRWLSKTKKRTPADTGELRRNWKVVGAFRSGDDYVVVLKNAVGYAVYVEEGHRTRSDGWWEGYHMSRISQKEVEKAMPARLERVMQRFFQSLGGD